MSTFWSGKWAEIWVNCGSEGFLGPITVVGNKLAAFVGDFNYCYNGRLRISLVITLLPSPTSTSSQELFRLSRLVN